MPADTSVMTPGGGRGKAYTCAALRPTRLPVRRGAGGDEQPGEQGQVDPDRPGGSRPNSHGYRYGIGAFLHGANAPSGQMCDTMKPRQYLLDGGGVTDALTGGAGTDTCLNGETSNGCEFPPPE